MIWYAVVTSYYDDGRVTANIVEEIESKDQPKDKYRSTSKCDIYTEHYSDLEQANDAVSIARSLSSNIY